MDKFFVDIKKDAVFLYIKNKKGKENSYIKYCLLHLRKPFDGGVYQNFDLWRFYEAFTYELIDGEFVKTLPYPIVSAGEWECALCICGTRDFHGGIHGYEHQKEFFAEMDGAPVDIDTPQSFWTDNFRFYQKSVIVKQGTLDEPVADHVKDYYFCDGGVTLKQDVKWLQDLEIAYAYLAMFPIRRTHDDTETGEVISDRAMTNLSDEVYDVGKLWHETPISPIKNAKSGVKWAKIWGSESGVTAEFTVLQNGVLDSNLFFIQNNESYNKLYYSCAGNGKRFPVKVGDDWHFEDRFEIYRV